MGSYTLNIRAVGQYFINQPTLEIWNDGFLEASALISNTGSDISLNLTYTGALPSSLEFRFNDALSEIGRSITLQSVRINDRHINANNFLNTEVITQSIAAEVDVLAASSLFNSDEPDISTFHPSDGNFTTASDSYRNLTGVNHSIDAQDGRDTIY